jgi:hypothetical protein
LNLLGRFFVPTTYLSSDTFQWIQERDGIPSKTLYDCDGLKQMFRHSVMSIFDAVIDARFEIVDGMLVSKDGRPIPTDSYGVPRSKLTVSGWCVDPTSGFHHYLFKIKVEVRLHLVFMLRKLRHLLEAGQSLSGWESEWLANMLSSSLETPSDPVTDKALIVVQTSESYFDMTGLIIAPRG